jgi:CO/xanthine dehydrogenase FAD-binding subunit
MKTFDYFSPKSLNDACSIVSLSGDGARILAGGTDVLVELRRPNSHSPALVIDISRIEELKGVRETGDSIVIGPLTTHDELHRSDLIARFAPLLKSAAAMIGSPQIRNRGTIGGNIMNAAACADTVPPLLALDAHIRLVSSSGQREIALADFFTKPYVTVARKDEILSEVRFPKLGPNMRSSFVKLGRRNALSIARLSVAVILGFNSKGLIEDARIVPGAAFPSWRRVRDAENVLLGQKPSKEVFVKTGEKVSDIMISYTGRRWSTEYKEPVIAVLVRRALEQCVKEEQKS